MHLQAQQAAHSVFGIKITNRSMEAWAVPAPHLCVCGNSTRLGHIQPLRPPGELGEVFWIYRSTPKPVCPLPLRASGLTSSISLASRRGFRRQCLAQHCGFHGRWGPSSTPGAVYWAEGSVGPSSPSHLLVLSKWARRSSGKQPQVGQDAGSK